MTPPARLIHAWRIGSPWLALLAPLAWLYALLAAINRRRQQNRAIRLNPSRRVIVIGNITLGGSGKTTLAGWLAEDLRKRGKSVAIISKGYGRVSRLPQPALADPNPARFGDEPAMLAWLFPSTPVWVCDDRLSALQTVAADYLICDDGLQDYRFSPRVEIGLIDGHSGFANVRLFPQGILREPVKRLQKCALVIQQGGEQLIPPAQGSFQLEITGFTNLRSSEHKSLSRALDDWRDQPLHLCCGLANNQRVFNQIDALGLRADKHPFPDHHPYCAGDIDHPGQVLLTAKDAIKCLPFVHQRCWRIDTQVNMPTNLAKAIRKLTA